MATGFDKVLGRLADQDLITPYFEAAVLADNWPDSYTVRIDSSPYYGLDEEGKPDGYFHPSTHPTLGERELYYRFHPATRDKLAYEPNTTERQMAFAVGSAVHGVVQTQMVMAGLVKPEDIEVEYVNKEHNVRGRIDWLANHPNGTRLLVQRGVLKSGQIVLAGTHFGRRILEWEGDPFPDNVALRACGALHALALTTKAPD